jgi:hypothetical protein
LKDGKMMISIMNHKACFLIAVVLLALSASSVTGQTTSFQYTGQLSDGGFPANGNYDFEFKLFDDLSSGAQQGATLQRLNGAVTNGL